MLSILQPTKQTLNKNIGQKKSNAELFWFKNNFQSLFWSSGISELS